jgi:hypothetical protein
VDEAATLLEQDDALVWVDVPECGDEAVTLLTNVLGCHRWRFVTVCNAIACQESGFIRISSYWSSTVRNESHPGMCTISNLIR